MRPVASSHTFKAYHDEDICLFIVYDPILLPPVSGGNYDESQGFFTYRDNTRTGLELGNITKNTAAIYFDFNTPITSNATLNTIAFMDMIIEVPVKEEIEEEVADIHLLGLYLIPTIGQLTLKLPSNQEVVSIEFSGSDGRYIGIVNFKESILPMNLIWKL